MNGRRWFAVAAGAVAALATVGVLAQSGGGYQFELFGLPGGGGSSAAAGYEIQGALGQAFAGQVEGSGWVLDGGFFGGSAGEQTFELYAPGLVSQP
jgi:hypothetical protein